MQVTSESDPYFLHSLSVNEEDFQGLKLDQSILVDFSTFPFKLIELLELCIESRTEKNPRFIGALGIRGGESAVRIIETNQFKHLSHISLFFRPGNDAAVKQYLAGRLAEFKAAKSALDDKVESMIQELEHTKDEAGRLHRELMELREVNSKCVAELQSQHALALAEVKEKALFDLESFKERAEREKAESEARFGEQTLRLQEKADELDRQVRVLVDAKYALEAKKSELRAQLVSAQNELEETRKECDHLRRCNRELDAENHEKEKGINQHLVRISALDQQVHDQEDMIANLSSRVETEATCRAAVETSLKETQASASKMEKRMEASIAEINKGNQIIERLQRELRASKGKMKLKSAMISQQESLLDERQMAVDKVLRENTSVRQELVDIRSENENLKVKVDDYRQKLEEAQELLRTNQQMIQWLNSQVTEAQLGKFGSRYPFRSSPPSVLHAKSMTSSAAPITSLSSILGASSKIPATTSVPTGATARCEPSCGVRQPLAATQSNPQDVFGSIQGTLGGPPPGLDSQLQQHVHPREPSLLPHLKPISSCRSTEQFTLNAMNGNNQPHAADYFDGTRRCYVPDRDWDRDTYNRRPSRVRGGMSSFAPSMEYQPLVGNMEQGTGDAADPSATAGPHVARYTVPTGTGYCTENDPSLGNVQRDASGAAKSRGGNSMGTAAPSGQPMRPLHEAAGAFAAKVGDAIAPGGSDARIVPKASQIGTSNGDDLGRAFRVPLMTAIASGS
ncbi:hypothetical protein CBR_g49985 [Chara braunii]|uniref:Spindle assembly abnormal protein 6 N-terminal domain-containing protein n=1 Tax=Chara braunii TaxID=69332 RepID=A0A388K5H0_CHABU|nr:hypothetical protein CBR_g49985 [Chara braunii]|eukprot:GBG65193.1 hypothetical protein CBR_g49985 [Chara braunii]